MKLGQLKKSLAKLPPDMDEMEVLIAFARKGERQYENLCFAGYVPQPGLESIVLGSTSEIQRMVENHEIEKPEGYFPPTHEDQEKE